MYFAPVALVIEPEIEMFATAAETSTEFGVTVRALNCGGLSVQVPEVRVTLNAAVVVDELFPKESVIPSVGVQLPVGNPTGIVPVKLNVKSFLLPLVVLTRVSPS
jgi:hypothetical protein